MDFASATPPPPRAPWTTGVAPLSAAPLVLSTANSVAAALSSPPRSVQATEDAGERRRELGRTLDERGRTASSTFINPFLYARSSKLVTMLGVPLPGCRTESQISENYRILYTCSTVQERLNEFDKGYWIKQ
uniref:Uncharacterized protein n=1 Tax=Oryza sativa subsp. indica TaxID=39946 RepID=A0A679BAR4_ORYSI|nr:hypothetical protein [Oryza sativa Indica Group]BBD82528.1 hypothetical protein [Oryza sativa Indica Group]